MDLDGFAANSVENKIGLDCQYAITVLSKPGMAGYSPQQGVGLKSCDTFIKLVDKGDCSRWAVPGNVLEDGKQVILGSRKVSETQFIGHATVVGVWPSFVCD